jgi:hypothetical protein
MIATIQSIKLGCSDQNLNICEFGLDMLLESQKPALSIPSLFESSVQERQGAA